MKEVELLLSNRRTFSGIFIRLSTWSWVSHVDFILEDGRLLGALPRNGVHIRDYNKDEFKKSLRVKIKNSNYHRVVPMAKELIGDKYDFTALFGHAFRRDWQSDSKWTCSEFIAFAFSESGDALFSNKKYFRITPRDLYIHNRIIPISEGL